MVGHAGLILLSILASVALGKLPIDLPPQFFNDNDLTELYARDIEPIPGPISFGHKYMTGMYGRSGRFLDSRASRADHWGGIGTLGDGVVL